MLDRSGFSLGYCFGTILMRSSFEDRYYDSIEKSIKKQRLFLVSVGENEEEEEFWIRGRELFTVYATPKGFSVLQDSPLEKELEDKLSDEDFSDYHHIFGSGSHYGGDHYTDFLPHQKYRNLRTQFTSLQDIITSIKSLEDSITIYAIHTKSRPYYLEEIEHYVKTKKNL